MDRISFSQAVEGYSLAAHARRLSPRTLADYNNTFRKLQNHLGDDRPIAKITRLLLQEFLAAQDSVGAGTLLNYHTGLSALWRWAAGTGVAVRLKSGLPIFPKAHTSFRFSFR